MKDNYKLDEQELELTLYNISTGHGGDLTQNTLTNDREKSLPSEISNSYCDDSYKVSKKNDKKVSEDIIMDVIGGIQAEKRLKANNSERVRFKRNYINYIIADYFSKCENMIKDSKDFNKTEKRYLIKTFTSVKELIKNNSCSYKVKYLIEQNNIKYIVEYLVQAIIDKQEGEVIKNLTNFLYNLPSQHYVVLDLIKVLKYKINSKFPNSKIDLCKEIDTIAEYKTSNSKFSKEKFPWNDKKTSAIDKICEGLNPSSIINNKHVFIIQKDFGYMNNKISHNEDSSVSYKSDNYLDNDFNDLNLLEDIDKDERISQEFKFEDSHDQNKYLFSYGDSFKINIYNDEGFLNDIYQRSPQYSLFNNWDN